MLKPDDQLYFERRATQERARAAAADRPEIRRVHNEMAERYTALLAGAGGPRLHVAVD